MSRDAKGKEFPVWARYMESIDAAGSLSAQTNIAGQTIPFAIYCPQEALVTMKLIENDSDVSDVTLVAGYHPLAVESITTTDVKIYALFAYKTSE